MSLRDYRYLGEEAEVLGTRLDAARKSLAGAKTEWAKLYWTNAVNQLVLQWKHLPILHDSDARVQIIPRWTISYDYYERDDGVGHGISDRMFDKLYREPDLQGSWDRNREKRLARLQ